MQTDNDPGADVPLVRRLASADRTALADVFDRFAPTLTRYAWASAGSEQDVRELVQETFLTLWQEAAGLDLATTALLPWLLVVCRDHAEARGRRETEHDGDGLTGDLASPGGADDARGRLRFVTDEIARLAPLDRRICELCLIEGHSYAEAATMLGLSVGAGTQRVSRSRARLKKAVTHDEH